MSKLTEQELDWHRESLALFARRNGLCMVSQMMDSGAMEGPFKRAKPYTISWLGLQLRKLRALTLDRAMRP